MLKELEFNERKEFNEGWDASKHNLGRRSNPYKVGTSERKQWLAGFNSHDSFKTK